MHPDSDTASIAHIISPYHRSIQGRPIRNYGIILSAVIESTPKCQPSISLWMLQFHRNWSIQSEMDGMITQLTMCSIHRELQNRLRDINCDIIQRFTVVMYSTHHRWTHPRTIRNYGIRGVATRLNHDSCLCRTMLESTDYDLKAIHLISQIFALASPSSIMTWEPSYQHFMTRISNPTEIRFYVIQLQVIRSLDITLGATIAIVVCIRYFK